MSLKLLVVLVLMAAFAFVIRSACSGLCGDDPQATFTSPDGRHEARVVQRSCGATTGFNTVVQLSSNRSEYQDVFSAGRDSPIEVQWRDSGKTLWIAPGGGGGSDRSIRQTVTVVDGVTVVLE